MMWLIVFAGAVPGFDRPRFDTDRMFSRLFSRRDPKTSTETPSVPPGRRVYAIGDIHGCAGLLRTLRAVILEDAASHAAARNVIVYLGDYIDRGPDSRTVIDMLANEPLPGFESVFLRGNHEETLLQFLDDPGVASGWLGYGGDATLYSYGVRPPDCADEDELLAAQASLSEQLPPSHLAFLRDSKMIHIEGDYAFVHAGVREDVPLDLQSPDDMLWIRDAFLRSDADFGKIVVHGHSISESPVVRRNRIGIDTGAFATGRLTCLALEGESRRFLSL